MRYAFSVAKRLLLLAAQAPGDSTPGGANDVLLLANATDGLLLADGSSFLILAGN